MTSMFGVMRTLTDPGDFVIMDRPIYTLFYVYTAHASREIHEPPPWQNGRIELAPSRMRSVM